MSGEDARDVGQPSGPDAPTDRVFRTPKVTINRVYTRQGDGGLTRLVGGQQIPKDDARIDAYGTVDELNAFIGAARQTLAELTASALGPGAQPARPAEPRMAVEPGAQPARPAEPRISEANAARLGELGRSLHRVQHELFNLGSILATLPEDVHPKQPRITQAEVDLLEAEMDRCQEDLAPLRSFVLPGGSRLNVDLHVARTVCRRAERLAVALVRASGEDPMPVTYLNRLSDALFVWSRWAAALLGAPEVLWEPDVSASGQRGAQTT